MASTQQNNTMAEFCNKMMKVVADAKQMPDADMEFLGAIEGDILTYLKPPVPATQGAGPMPGGPTDPTGGMNGAMASVMGQPQAAMPPSPDTMQRIAPQ